jgi:hypothetical protein
MVSMIGGKHEEAMLMRAEQTQGSRRRVRPFSSDGTLL